MCNRFLLNRRRFQGLNLVVIALLSLLASSFSFSAQPQKRQTLASDCNPAKPYDENQPDYIFISEPGCFYLERDMSISWPKMFKLSETKYTLVGSDLAIGISANNVVIDLNGKTIKAISSASGVRYLEGPTKEVHSITIRNGTIALKNLPEVQPLNGQGIFLNSEGIDVERAYRKHNYSDFGASKKASEFVPMQFRKVKYILENLTIQTGNWAAFLAGDGIVVRNCTIEVNSENALIIMGPNAIIENNTFVFRFVPGLSTVTPAIQSGPLLRSAIYLHAANDAIIRGNSIKIDQRDAPVSAVSAVDSKGIKLEGNTFNHENFVELRGESSATLKNNYIRLSKSSIKKAVPDRTLSSELSGDGK